MTADEGHLCEDDCTYCDAGSCENRGSGAGDECAPCHVCDSPGGDCSAETGNDGNLCEDDCTYCDAGSCENRDPGNTTECGTCEECGTGGGACDNVTAENGKNCNTQCSHCVSGSCDTKGTGDLCNDGDDCTSGDHCDGIGPEDEHCSGSTYTCNEHGTCNAEDDYCTCTEQYGGNYCDECNEGYAGYPECLAIGSAEADGDLIITEIMPDPITVLDEDGEWFEVYNPASDMYIDMDGLTIKDDDTDSHLITGQVLVPPQGYAVLGINGDISTNGNVTVDYAYGIDIILDNADDEIELKNGETTIDYVAYDDAVLWPDREGASMFLNSLSYNEDNNDPIFWCEEIEHIYNSVDLISMSDYGTPGVENSICLVCDDFNRANSGTVDGWTKQSGSWSIEGNTLLSNCTSGNGYITYDGLSAIDGCITARVIHQGEIPSITKELGVTARWVGDLNRIAGMIGDWNLDGTWDQMMIFNDTMGQGLVSLDLGTDVIIQFEFTGTTGILRVDTDRNGTWDYTMTKTFLDNTNTAAVEVWSQYNTSGDRVDDWCFSRSCDLAKTDCAAVWEMTPEKLIEASETEPAVPRQQGVPVKEWIDENGETQMGFID